MSKSNFVGKKIVKMFSRIQSGMFQVYKKEISWVKMNKKMKPSPKNFLFPK
jgi:hypothetical protein